MIKAGSIPSPPSDMGEGTDFCPAGGEGLREGGFYFFGRKAAFKGIDGEQDFFHGCHNISLAIHAQASASASAL